MNNSRFSSLIYRIIGKPERWHEDYIDVMHQILDETDSFEEPYNFSELEVGDQIISSLKRSNQALKAFSTLLDKSRLKMIMLDDRHSPIYHNQNAEKLLTHLLCQNDGKKLTPGLLKLLPDSPDASSNNSQNVLMALDYRDENGDQIYFKSIRSKVDDNPNQTQFHVLMVLDQSHAQNELNSELIAKYELTEKEQMVLRGLIHGKTIREIAEESFVSENTVKTHIKAIFRKTDTNSQTAVVRLILTHESQILDSYFESEVDGPLLFEEPSIDREVVLSNGLKIAYCEYGPEQGRPLIVFHSGYGCRLSIPPAYKEICERTNRRIIIPDRPGIGKTPFIQQHPEGWNARLQEFIDLLGIGEYDILGSIFGCQLAISFAMTADKRLQKLILCSPVVINQKSDTRYLTGILSPTARLVRSSNRFAREIYQLWLKSVTLNLGTHYRSMLDSSLGSAERDPFIKDGTFDLLINVFHEGSRLSLKGISHEMVFCLSPLKLDLSKLTIPIEVWYGTEDKRISLEGVESIIGDLPNHRLNVRKGYSEHIYYALFEEIIT